MNVPEKIGTVILNSQLIELTIEYLFLIAKLDEINDNKLKSIKKNKKSHNLNFENFWEFNSGLSLGNHKDILLCISNTSHFKSFFNGFDFERFSNFVEMRNTCVHNFVKINFKNKNITHYLNKAVIESHHFATYFRGFAYQFEVLKNLHFSKIEKSIQILFNKDHQYCINYYKKHVIK